MDGATNNLMWTEPYDGDLSDIFGIQAEIAMNIANSLRADFSVAEQESIETPPTNSPEAYALFLKAVTLVRQGIGGGSDASIATRLAIQNFLDEALELDPEFAVAHALKAGVYGSSRFFDSVRNEEDWLAFSAEIDRLRVEHASMALALDPSLGRAHAVLATVHLNNWRGAEAEAEAEQALRLSPNDPTTAALFADIEGVVRNRIDDAIRYQERRAQLDPNNAQAFNTLGAYLNQARRFDEALGALQQCLVLDPLDGGCRRQMALSEFALGHHEQALDSLRALQQVSGPASLAFIAPGFGLLGQPDDALRSFERIREISAEQYIDPVIWAWAYMGIGDYDEALNRLNIAAENPKLIQVGFMAWFFMGNIWRDPMLEETAFVEVREKLRPR
ncbi:MAG: tetratricopeptide (TPR) repeat protein [Hyphomicrobiaceae bacterium]